MPGLFNRIGEIEEFYGKLFYILLVICKITMSEWTADVSKVKIKNSAI